MRESSRGLAQSVQTRLVTHARRIDGATLAGAISSTFERRGTALGPELPVALTAAFASVPGKPEQWEGFLRKSRLPLDAQFELVVADVARFLRPVVAALIGGDEFAGRWPPSGPWE